MSEQSFVAGMLRLVDEHAIDVHRHDLELPETLIVQGWISPLATANAGLRGH